MRATKHRQSNDKLLITNLSQQAHNATTTSLLRQNDVTTWFWRNNDVIITLCARWGAEWGKPLHKKAKMSLSEMYTEKYWNMR